jgi:hypothetical protein
LQEFSIVGGLLKIGDSARRQGSFLVILRIAGAQYNNRYPGEMGMLAQAFEDNEAVSSGQAEIEDDEIGTLFLSSRNGGVAITGNGDAEIVGQQPQP